MIAGTVHAATPEQRGVALARALEAPGPPPASGVPRQRGRPRPAARDAAVPALDGGQRLVVLDTLSSVLEGAYAHLPQKRSAYAVDPVQALRLLRLRAAGLTDAQFHLAVTGTVTSLRDGHTRYTGPAVDQGTVAVLPFLVEAYGPPDAPRFLVTKALADSRVVPDPDFAAGVTVESWNGVPMARAVDVHADRETGGRPDTRRARALESLTIRALDHGPPPDERWVVVGYRTANGRRGEVRLDWRVVRPGSAPTAVPSDPVAPAAHRMAMDPRAEAARRAKKLLFAHGRWAAERRAESLGGSLGQGDPGLLPTSFPDNLTARTIARGRYGHVRIWSFDLDDADAFVTEVARLLALLPPGGLVVDIRGNPGGLVWAAERLLQLLTSETVAPTRFSLLATPLTRAMAASPLNRLELGAWSASLRDAVTTGEAWSRPLPLTDPDSCNDVGRVYAGPLVLVGDASTYSAGDLFAAGFVDHGIGPFVVVGEATGAGGANVWTDGLLRGALAGTPYALPALPAGVSFTMSFRRALRSGLGDGLALEDLGVRGIPYPLTRRDLTAGNADLLRFATGLLA